MVREVVFFYLWVCMYVCVYATRREERGGQGVLYVTLG